MARTIGKVKSISGKAAVKTTNDQLHVLKVGEALHENEMVYALGADSKVTLTLEGGRELTLNGYDEILLDKSVFTALEEGEALDVKALQQALAEALTPENMEETAAGEEVVGDANAGAEYASRNDARGNPSSYLTGTDSSALGVTFDTLQNENFAPQAFDDNGTAVEEGSGDDYDAPVIATGNLLSNDTDDLLPNPPADLDVTAITSNDTNNPTNAVGGFFIIEGKYGTLVLNGETGEYTYTVDESNPTVDTMNIGDTLQESFSYVVNDGALGDNAVLTITINGTNDAPVATGEGGYDLSVDSDAALSNISAYPTEGAAVKFIVETQAGETVTFNWQFTAGDYMPYNDFAFVGVDNGNLVLLSNVATVGNYGTSGLQTYSITFSEAGAHTITFGVSDYGDTGVDSSLNISNMNGGNLLSVETLGNASGSGSTYLLTTAGASVSQLNNFLDTDMVIGDLINSMEGNEADTAVAAEGNVLLNDTDVDNPHEQLSVISLNGEDVPQNEGSLTYQGLYGVLTIDAQGNFTYTPYDAESEMPGAATVNALNIGDMVQETFTYTISDNEEEGAKTDTAVLRVTINGTNDAPVATADYGTSIEGNESDDVVPAEGNVLGGDYDVDNSNLSVISVNGQEVSEDEPLTIEGAFGILVIASDGSYTYTPYESDSDHPNAGLVDALNEGESLTESFSYTISDNEEGGAKTDSATLTITIEGTNDAPVAEADIVAISEERFWPLYINVLENDSDVDSDTLSLISADIAEGDGWVDISHGMVKYYPDWFENQSLNEGEVKSVVIEYTIADDMGKESTSTVTVNISGMNDHPVAVLDYASGDENHLFVMNVLANDWDIDSEDDPSNFSLDTISYSGPGSASIVNNQLQFDPGNAFDYLNVGEKATVTVWYKMSDDSGADSNWSKAVITLTGSNDEPVAIEDAVFITEDRLLGVSINVLANDSDVDSEHLSLVGAEIIEGDGYVAISHGMVKYYPNWVDNQSLNEGDIKNVMIEYTIKDEQGATATSTVAVTITGVNDYPVAVVDFASGDENHLFSINVLANDTDIDSGDNPSNFNLDAISYSGPGTASIVNNQLQFNPGNAFDYLNVGEKATVSIWYKMSDDSGAQSSWTLATLRLLGSNDGPVAVDDFSEADYTTYTIDLESGNDWNQVTITPIGTAQSEVYFNPGNQKIGIVNTENPDNQSIDNAGVNEGIKFTFGGMLQHLEVKFDSFNSPQDSTIWQAMLGSTVVMQNTFSGNPQDTLVIDTGNSVFDTLVLQTPNGEHVSFYIDALKGYGLDIDSALTVTENEPILISESYLMANDSDIDSDSLNIIDIDTTGTVGEVTIDADGNITYDPAGRFDHLGAGEIGTDTFTYLLSDGDATDTATVTINIIGSEGSSDSTCQLNLSDVLKNNFHDYNAGSGYDTVILKGDTSGNVDFGEISSQLDNIEHLDLQNGAKTFVNITPEKVADMTDDDNYLRISGEANDSLELDGFTLDTDTSANLDGYNAYVGSFGGEDVILHIDTDIHIIP